MESMPRYKKIEVAVLGVLVPLALTAYTATLLANGKALFWGRSETIAYQSGAAYFVSLLWFGVSGLMLSQFLLRPMQLGGSKGYKLATALSVALVIVGLASAVVLV